MGFFSKSSDEQQYADAHEKVTGTSHKAELSHELIAGAAAYAAAKAFEKHESKDGPPSHAQAKEIIAGVTGAFIDRIFETKGLDAIDKERTKRDAQKKAEAQIEPNYNASGNFVGK